MKPVQFVVEEIRRSGIPADGPDRFLSSLLRAPEAKIIQVLSMQGANVPKFNVSDGMVHIPSAEFETYRLCLQLPDYSDWVGPRSFEEKKIALEEKWRYRTFLSGLVTAAVSAIVAVSIAVLGKPTSSATGKVPSGVIRACESNLVRLSVLAGRSDQTVAQLKQAIINSEGSCIPMIQTVRGVE